MPAGLTRNSNPVPDDTASQKGHPLGSGVERTVSIIDCAKAAPGRAKESNKHSRKLKNLTFPNGAAIDLGEFTCAYINLGLCDRIANEDPHE